MVEQPRSWRLEENGNVVFAAACAEFACYSEKSGAVSARHRRPAWRLALSRGGQVVAADDTGRTVAGSGLLIPPGFFHRIEHSTGLTSVWIDPHRLTIPGPPRIHALESVQTRRLLAATTESLDVARLRRTVRQELGAAPPLDPRLDRALELLDEGIDIDGLGDHIGLSARRLRQLSQQTMGFPLTALRRWHQVCEAGLQLPFHPAAEVAARTGFADQSHLIRTMVALCGRTPGSLPGSRA
ncbi:helix-turn-helix domain-containing protein [Nocardia sp. NPDC020380]|uniref:helix-turn-helix domain-containing protein n=1 Tax=Nocardia sp. NPDC020380 TaxID=3364309 RepID=UPI00378E0386